MKLIDTIIRQPLAVAFTRGSGSSSGTTGLDSSRDAASVTISATDGSFAVVPEATATSAGVLTAADKTALDEVAATPAHHYESKAAVEAATLPATLDFVRTAGFAAAGDGGAALYRRVAAQPPHAGRIQSADGAWWEIAEPALRPEMFGAKGDGVTDDTAAFQSAIDALPAGGELRLSVREYRANIVCTRDNIRIVGQSQRSSQTGGVAIVPFDTTLPALKLGAAGQQLDDFRLEHVTLHGDSNTHQKGLEIVNAARCWFRNVTISGFSSWTLSMTSATGGFTSYLYFDGCSFTNSNGVAIKATYGAVWTTAVYFSNCEVIDKPGGRAIDTDGVDLRFVNVWFQCQDGAGILLKGGAKLYGQNMVVDSGNSADVLVELDDNGPLADRLIGTVLLDGQVRYLDGTVQTVSGPASGPYRSIFNYPMVQGRLAFADVGYANPHEQDVYRQDASIYWSGGNFDLATTGQNIRLMPGSGVAEIRADGSASTYTRLRNSTSSGDIQLDGTGSLQVKPSVGSTILCSAGVKRWVVADSSFFPQTDNLYNIGYAGGRVKEIFAANGTINTSDAREKQDVRPLDEAEARVARRLKGLFRMFRWRDAVATKGGDARLHCGVIAQDVVAAFEAEGLDAHRYGLLCHDQLEGGDRYSVRYEELLAFVLAAM